MDHHPNHMQSPQDQPPSYTQTRNSPGITLPPVSSIEPPPQHERTLPPLSSTVQVTPWISANPLSVYYQPNSSGVVDSLDCMDGQTTSSPDNRGRNSGSNLSIDDPDVRLAAEALGDLRADFVSSPPLRSRGRSSKHGRSREPEPLLSLLTTTHPIIGTAIGGSISAYSASKNYSPRFKSSAEYVERRFTPVVNTLGTVGRVTGVEGGVRWFLGGRRRGGRKSQKSVAASSKLGTMTATSVDMERESSHKRRKINTPSSDQMDLDSPEALGVVAKGPVIYDLAHRERRSSQTSSVAESLPPYDDHRSPTYDEVETPRSLKESHEQEQRQEDQEQSERALTSTRDDETSDPTWQSRLILSTSGLSIAMSDESLRSLKYCLSWLRWANHHIERVIVALKTALEEYERAIAGAITNGEHTDGQLITKSEADRSMLVHRIAELKGDVMKTMKDVVEVVSKYAGGALPENARALVRHQLTSLPQRFRLANPSHPPKSRDGQGNGESSTSDSDLRDSAQRVMVLAKEGLDMMVQISGVVDGTIVSAEEWCERLGRKKSGHDERNGDASDAEARREKQAVGEALAAMNQRNDMDVA